MAIRNKLNLILCICLVFDTTPKKWHQTFVLHTQNSMSFVLRTQKSEPKSRPKKVGKKAARKVGKKFIPEPVLLLS